MSAILEKLDPLEVIERTIRDDHKRHRYQWACIPPQQQWCNEAGNISDEYDTDELMMVIAENYEGNGNYDELAIGRYVAEQYQGSVELEVDKSIASNE